MYTKQEIILRKYRDGKSQRSISKELGISRKTVSRYIKQYEEILQTVKDPGEALRISLTIEPTYNSSNRQKVRLTREVQEAIDIMLEENQKKLMSGLGKQQLKKIDILNKLQEQGYNIGYTSVCNYISEKQQRQHKKEAFIRQEYSPGNICEFDWGEVKLTIGGHQQKYQLAVFTSGYGNHRYSHLFERQDTLAFMESHVYFFRYTGGVYREMVYDNMRVAVSKFVGKHEKEPTQALLDLRSHYHFNHRFCNAYRGNEKGHVERSVEYVRRKAFGLKSEFGTLEQANEYLLGIIEKLNNTKQQLTSKTANEMFAEEKKYLMELREDLACAQHAQLRVDKYATVSYRTNRYSVPEQLVGEFVDVKIYSSKLEFYYDNHLLALHQRTYGKHRWVITLEHYLETFKRKPGALSGSKALASREELKKIYDDWFHNTPRDFIELLHYCYQNKIDDQALTEAVSHLTLNPSAKVTSEKLMALLGNKVCKKPAKQPTESQTSFLSKQHLLQTAQLMG
jgi:transposase